MSRIIIFLFSLSFFALSDEKLKNDNYLIKSNKIILNGREIEEKEKINIEEIEVDEVITLAPGQTEVVFEDKYGKWPTINVEFD